MEYVDKNTLSLRLKGSIVKFNCTLFRVNEIKDEGIVEGISILNQTTYILPYQLLDLSPIPLGFVNTPTHCVYLYRQPARLYKQGLTYENCKLCYSRKNLTYYLNFLPSTIMNVFPSFDEAWESGIKLENINGPLRAFSRWFAINPHRNQLYYKDLIVGKITKSGDFELEEFSRCLIELLEEVLYENE